MEIIEATGLDRKSGGAEWRDLQCRDQTGPMSSSSILFQARLMRQAQGEAISKNTL
jgi:hypothetical protein